MQQTLAKMKATGYRPWNVEQRIPGCNRTRDLFGCIDALGIGNGETLAVQCTSASNVSARAKKMTEAEALPDMRKAGWRIQVWGFRKDGRCRVVDLS